MKRMSSDAVTASTPCWKRQCVIAASSRVLIMPPCMIPIYPWQVQSGSKCAETLSSVHAWDFMPSEFKCPQTMQEAWLGGVATRWKCCVKRDSVFHSAVPGKNNSEPAGCRLRFIFARLCTTGRFVAAACQWQTRSRWRRGVRKSTPCFPRRQKSRTIVDLDACFSLPRALVRRFVPLWRCRGPFHGAVTRRPFQVSNGVVLHIPFPSLVVRYCVAWQDSL